MSEHPSAETFHGLLSSNGLRDRATVQAEAALASFFKLEAEVQLRFATVVDAYITASLGEPETQAAQERRLRIEYLDAMRAAAAFHSLEAGNGPTIAQYREARDALGLLPTHQDITRLFERWSRAADILCGRARHRTSRQRVLQRRAKKAARHFGVEQRHIENVQRWLDQPDRADRTRKDYDQFAYATNEAEPDARKHLVLGSAIQGRWGVGFADFVAFVRGDITIEEARERHVAHVRVQSDCELMTRKHVLAALGCTGAQLTRHIAYGRFPPAPLRFPGNQPAWLRADVEACVAGKEVPERDPVELQHQYLARREVVELLDANVDTVKAWLRLRRWDKVPRPAATFERFSYWRRADVERWLARRRAASRSP